MRRHCHVVLPVLNPLRSGTAPLVMINQQNDGIIRVYHGAVPFVFSFAILLGSLLS